MSEGKRTTTEDARRVGDEIGVDWDRFDLEQFRAGMDVEFEHGSHDPQTYFRRFLNAKTAASNPVAVSRKPALRSVLAP